MRRLGRPVVRVDGLAQVAHGGFFGQVAVSVEAGDVLGGRRTALAVVAQDETGADGARELAAAQKPRVGSVGSRGTGHRQRRVTA